MIGESEFILIQVEKHAVWKDQEVIEANENKRRLSGFHCFVFKFRLF